eukprot:m51a1_g7445 putative serine threonine protein kinase (553) ;mRNA; r:96566-98415
MRSRQPTQRSTTAPYGVLVVLGSPAAAPLAPPAPWGLAATGSPACALRAAPAGQQQGSPVCSSAEVVQAIHHACEQSPLSLTRSPRTARDPRSPLFATIAPLDFCAGFDLAREIAQCPEGGVVTVPVGVHRVEGPLVFERAVSVVGASAQSTAVAVLVRSPERPAVSVRPGAVVRLERAKWGIADGSPDSSVLLRATGAGSGVVATDCAFRGPLWFREGSAGSFARCDLRVPCGELSAVIATGRGTSFAASSCRVHDSTGGGVLGSGPASTVVIESSSFESVRVAGVISHGGASVRVSRSAFVTCSAGAVAREKGTMAVDDCTFVDSAKGAVVVETGASCRVAACDVRSACAATASLAAVGSGSEVHVLDTTVVSTDAVGVLSSRGARATATRCSLTGGAASSSWGVCVSRGSELVVDSCVVCAHTVAEAQADGDSRLTVRSSTLHSGRGQGVAVGGDAVASLSEVEVRDTTGSAVLLKDRARATLARCAVWQAGMVRIQDSASASVIESDVQGGIDCGASAKVEVTKPVEGSPKPSSVIQKDVTGTQSQNL